MVDVVFIGAIGSALMILMCYSFLYKENPFYRIMESIYVGTTLGWGLSTSLNRLNASLDPFYKDMGTYWWYAGALLIGLLWYTYWSKRYYFLYRIPLAYGVGLGIGTSFYGIVYSSFIAQITATFKGFGATPWDTFNNILIAIGTLTSVFVFYFSREHTGAMRYVSKIGRYFILVFLGSSFGNTIMGRTALAISMAQELMKYPQYWMVPLVIVIFLGIEMLKRLGYLREFSPKIAQAFNVPAKGEATQ